MGHVYDAAIRPGRWKRALDSVADATHARAIALVIRHDDPKKRDLTMLSSEYLRFSRTPRGLYYGLRLGRLQEADWGFLSQQSEHEILPDTATGLSPAELDTRADYAYLRKRLGVGRRLGVRLNADRMWFDAISLGFDSQNAAIPNIAPTALGPLLPHLTKAVELGRVFAALKARYKAVLTALDHVQIGLAVALPSGEILVKNAAADRLLQGANGISLGADNLLKTRDPDLAAALKAHIQSAARTADGQEDAPERLINLRRGPEQSDLMIDIAPLRDASDELQATPQGALVTFIDPDDAPSVQTARFSRIYDLTAAEAEICTLLLDGLDLDQIAETRNTTPVTAKNQIASIYQKTGVRRRAELIRLIMRCLPPVS